jgi:CheY-like chemotaxis protein
VRIGNAAADQFQLDVFGELLDAAYRGRELTGQLSERGWKRQQALLNYLGNALKFTERGEIVLYLDQLASEGKRIKVRFTVTDTGVGIDAEAMSRLFQNFEQADNSTTRKFGGSGLGLSITRHLAKMMGGETGAESEPEKGSKFWFTASFELPVDISAGTSTPAASSSAFPPEELLKRDFKGVRVLVCEENDINHEISSELLTCAGLVVDVAENGAVAIALADKAEYRLVLMDMQMPVVDGLDAARELRKMPNYIATPIVAMTANAFEADRKACFAAGMDHFLTKPVKPEVLFELIYGLLNRRRHP